MNRRLLAFALLTVGCGGEDDRGFRNPRWWELSALQVDRRLAVQQLRLHQVLDSLPALVGRFPAGAATFVAGADSAPPLEHQKISTTLGRLWPPGGAKDFRLAVAFYRPSVLDSARRHGVFEGTILPERTDGKTCVIAIAEQRNWQRDWVSPNERRLRSLVAPCLYLARFGHPGHAVARWLSETGYQGVQSAEWLFRPGVPTLSFDYWGQSDRGEWISPLLVAFGRDQLPPYWSGAPAVGCLAGRAGSCDEFVRGPRRSYRGAALPVMVGVAAVDDDYYPELGGRSQWVDDLIRTRGEAAFGTFWRSEADLPAAFRTAYGEDLGPAVARWERHDWEQRRERAPVRLGAPIDPVTAVAGLGWGLLILLLPLVAARRRTMF